MYNSLDKNAEEVSEIAKSNVIVSDVSGDVLGTNHVQVTIRHAADEAVYVLDAAIGEVENLIGVATKQKKRGRRPKATVVAAPAPVAEPETAAEVAA